MGAGTYVVAVSGGVDSMVLLDLLRQQTGVKAVVAHFDHGIRDDSSEDRKLVQRVAKKHSLPFVHENGKLGIGTSEAHARKARYTFLDRVAKASQAKAILTAHHQDDVLETAVINLIRGTGRRGLTSLRSTDGIVRPLLSYNKEQIRDYAQSHAIAWHEDTTNTDTTYLRNHVRANVLPKLTDGQRAQLVILVEDLRSINDSLDNQIIGLLHVQPAADTIDRAWFIHQPHDIAREIVHTWLRQRSVKDITKKTIERLVVAMKTGKVGSKIDVDHGHFILITKVALALKPRER